MGHMDGGERKTCVCVAPISLDHLVYLGKIQMFSLLLLLLLLLPLLLLLMSCLLLLLSCAFCCCCCASRWYCSCADHAPDNALFHCDVSRTNFLRNFSKIILAMVEGSR